MKEKQLLFIDGSVNNQLKVGYGAALVINETEFSEIDLRERIIINKFSNTSSTKLELQTLIWAFGKLEDSTRKVVVYTDSQNIVGLPARRKTLEEADYHSKKGKLLNHHELYRAFFKITDNLDCEFVKVEGHQASKNKNDYDKIFTLVDRAARKASRDLKSSS
ncbi:MAG: ribonuclease HI [Bacteroidota bacterium]